MDLRHVGIVAALVTGLLAMLVVGHLSLLFLETKGKRIKPDDNEVVIREHEGHGYRELPKGLHQGTAIGNGITDILYWF